MSSTSHTTTREVEITKPLPIEVEITKPLPIQTSETSPPAFAREVIQSNPGQLNVTVDNFPVQDHMQNLEHYKEIASEATDVVWTPQSGYKIHLVSLVVSASAAGNTILYKRTLPATDNILMTLVLEKGTLAFGLNTDLDFDWDQQLVAYYQNGGSEICYVTAIGHEHNPDEFPP